MWLKNVTHIILFGFLLYNWNFFAQEKKTFLQQRFEFQGEFISKKSSKTDLEEIKSKLKRIGIQFTYSQLKYNSKKEIIRLAIRLKNQQSEFSSQWNQKNIPIPTIKIGEINGIVTIQSNFKKPTYSFIEN